MYLLRNIAWALRALLYLHDKVHTVAAEAAAPAAAPAAALAAAPAADPWIHGSISFIMNHIFYYEMKSMRQEVTRQHKKDQWALDDVVTHTEVQSIA